MRVPTGQVSVFGLGESSRGMRDNTPGFVVCQLIYDHPGPCIARVGLQVETPGAGRWRRNRPEWASWTAIVNGVKEAIGRASQVVLEWLGAARKSGPKGNRRIAFDPERSEGEHSTLWVVHRVLQPFALRASRTQH